METLTLELAGTLKGRKIRYTAPAYLHNRSPQGTMVIGGMISEWDYHRTRPCPGYESRTDYWESNIRPEWIEELKNNILLLDGEGRWGYPYMRCRLHNPFFDEDTFTIGDMDRAVSFEIIEENQDRRTTVRQD